MNEQEMQFADPDWKPASTFSSNQEDAALRVPPSSTSTPDSYYEPQVVARENIYTQGYRASDRPSFVSSAPQQSYNRRAYPTRSRSYWWIWLVAALFFLGLVGSFSGASHGFNRGFQSAGPRPPFNQSQFAGNNQPFRAYKLGDASQLVINDPNGSVLVQTSQSNSDQVSVQSQDETAVTESNQTMSINVTDGGDNQITVVVPRGLALNVQTGDGDIEVDGFNGSLSAQTSQGTIALQGDVLTGQGVINGGDGEIDFSGSLDPQSSYQFITDSGDITLSLPQNSALQIQHSEQNGGSFSSDFSAQSGPAPRASLTTKTNTGDVEINAR